MGNKITTRQEAIKLGLKKYFTGKLCKHGHSAERNIGNSGCTECIAILRASNDQKIRHRVRAKNYYEKNKEDRLAYAKNRRLLNPEKVAECSKKTYVNNREKNINRTRRNNRSDASYKTYYHRLVGHCCRETNNGKLKTKCKNCKKWFLPTTLAVKHRISAINGTAKSPGIENNLYCSDDCKNRCDTYRSIKTQKSLRIKIHKARCHQSSNRNALKSNQIDRYGYMFCEKCGFKTDKLELHHGIMVTDNPLEADNMAHQLLLCVGCHKKPEVHCRE